jgi:hypothetical protein
VGIKNNGGNNSKETKYSWTKEGLIVQKAGYATSASYNTM